MAVQGSGNPSCSCTSCFYKTESENPSVRKIIQHGTRIDKLFLDEFIPLRERKLLDRLVRTRAVYDDVRTQLLADSSEVAEKAILKKRKHSAHKKLNRNKSSALIELVDMVDKGAVMDSKSSECCSCCICASKALRNQQEIGTGAGKRHRHRHRHGSRMLSKSSDTGRYRSRGNRRRSVQFKTKHIQSDPCTCTRGLNNIGKHTSKGRHKRTRRDRSVPHVSNSHEIIQKSVRKLKHSRTALDRSKTKLKRSIESSARRSIDKVKNARDKAREKIDSSIHRRPKAKKDFELPDFTEEQTNFKIRNDSIVKFKEKLKRNRELKNFECKHVCDPEECIPAECFEKLKRRKAHRKRKSASYGKHEASMGDTSVNITDSCKRCVPVDCVPGKCDPEECREKIRLKKELSDNRAVNHETILRDKNFGIAPYAKSNSSDASVQAKLAPEKSIIISDKKLKFKAKNRESEKETGHKTTSEANILSERMEKNVRAGTKSPKLKRTQDVKSHQKTTSKEHKAVEKRKGIKRRGNKSKEIKSVTQHPAGFVKESTSSLNKKLSTRPVGLKNKSSSASIKSLTERQHKTKTTKHAHQTRSFSSVSSSRSEKMWRGNKKTLEEATTRPSEQAVKVGSSFSFGIEFYKEKPSNVQVTELRQPKGIKHKAFKTNEDQGHKNKVRNPSQEDLHAEYAKKVKKAELTLKRCLCSLRLKKKHIAQGKMRFHPNLSKTLLPFECERNICVPRECDPIQCSKRIETRNKKLSSTNRQTKSTSSISSKSVSSGTSKNIRVYSPSVTKRAIEAVGSEPKRQAVRISSSFSFKIEFYKDNPADGNLVPNETNVEKRQNKMTDVATHKVKHKKSQSSTTGKSKYTLTNHSLRRCFCTLKLGKNDRKRNKSLSLTKSTATSNKSFIKAPKISTEVTSRGIVTDKQKYRTVPKQKLTPQECEPGVCVPGECDPYECLEIISKRNKGQVKRRSIQAGTERRRTRSTSSVTSKSVTPKAKKVQSTSLFAYKSEVPTQHAKKNLAPRRVKTSPSSLDRQAVRIGSSFSFDIEFFKEKTAGYPAPHETQRTREKTRSNAEKKRAKLKNRGLQGDYKHQQKSVIIGTEKKERNVMIGPAKKKCFCTLKLHKTGKIRRMQDAVDTGTGTAVFRESKQLKIETISMGTKTKGKYKNFQQLEQYECEPYVCVPGECDAYECLERIKRRKPSSKDFGVGTTRSKMKTTSSGTNKLSTRSKKIVAKSKEKKLKAMKTQKSIKSPKVNIEPSKFSRQAVKIGSSFSFDIQFYKDRSSTSQARAIVAQGLSKPFVKSVESKTTRKVKDKGGRPHKISMSQRSSQVELIKGKHKGTGVAPMLKRCFCTLKLQKNKQNKIISPNKNPKVYAVTHLTKLPDNTIPRRIPWISHINNTGFSFSMPYKSLNPYVMPSKPITSSDSGTSGVFKYKEMQSYFKENKQKYAQLQPSVKNSVQKSVELKSRITKRIEFVKETEDYLVLKKRESVKTTYTESEISTKINWKAITDSTSTLKYWESSTNKSNLSQLNPFLKRCYCTMNMLVPARRSKKKARHKLEPYECEPGVCVPDECDPYECERRIMRRLRKGVSKMSGTNIRTKSTSSYAPSSAVGSRGTKARSEMSRPAKAHAKTQPKGIKYKSYPKPMTQTQNRQAVRVGSKFSFDIEFSKDRSQSSVVRKNVKEPKTHPRTKHSHKKVSPRDAKLITKGTKGASVKRSDSVTQSNIARMENRGSDANPMLKRCFCTLKLQKKGARQRERKPSTDQGTTPSRKRRDVKPVVRTVDSTQNTKAVKSHKLEPYECEPNVCVPGECNPLQCLELIKKRRKHTKSSGTDSMRSSTSTSSSARIKKNRKGKQIQAEFKQKNAIAKKSSPKSPPPTRPKPLREKSLEPPSRRQAVRVGSSFNFNVEFYKDRSQAQEESVRYSAPPKPARVRESKVIVTKKRAAKHVGSKTEVAERSSQDSKLVRHRQSQFEGLVKNVQSTMTNSIIKRCFCTAKLHGANTGTQMKQRENKSQTLLKRCFCTLKSLTTVKHKPHAPPSKTAHMGTETKLPPVKVEREMNTRRAHNMRPRTLEPHECEPGICIPNECDPYVCNENIKKRNAKLHERSSNTNEPGRKSTSSSFTSTTSRHKNTQAKTKVVAIKAANTTKKRESSKEYIVKESHKLPPPSPMSSRKQAVRIGSTFSFDIEFYKEKSPHYQEVQAAAKAIKRTPHTASTQGTGTNSSFTNRGVMNDERIGQNQGSQASVAREHRGTGIGTMIKRCFCTLKLQKQKNNDKQPKPRKPQTKDQTTAPTKAVAKNKAPPKAEAKTRPGTKSPVMKGTPDMHAKSIATAKAKPVKYKLEPFECESGVCVPGECDPYKCDKLIQKRNRRNSSTSTQRQRTKSTSSKVGGATKYKHRNVQHGKQVPQHERKELRVKERRPARVSVVAAPGSQNSKSRQAVRIGSNFSFNVEFFKDRSYAGGDITPRVQRVTSPPPKVEKVRHVRTTSDAAGGGEKNIKHKKLQGDLDVRHTDSQAVKDVRSTMTGMPSILKRCFCTLKLHKGENKEVKRPDVKSTASIGTQDNIKVHGKTGGTNKGTHTQAVPENKIRNLEPYECEPGICVPNECDPYECEKRIKKRQMQSKMAGTGRAKGRSVSSMVSKSSRAKAKHTQAKQQDHHVKPQRERVQRNSGESKKRAVQPTSASNASSKRQAVKIGSSFSFNVEFYKDRPMCSPLVDQTVVIPPPSEKRRKVKHTTTEPNKRKHSTASQRGTGSHHRHSQSEGAKTESKGSSIGPLLKRCFCTLKLQKTGKHEVIQKVQAQKPQPKPGVGTSTKDIPKISATSKDASTGVRKKIRQLKPYECVPGVCVPGTCDPYECDKLIKRRMKHLGAGTETSRLRSAFTMTSHDPKLRTVKTQLYARTKEHKQEHKREHKQIRETKPIRTSIQSSKRTANRTSRQAVRLGSNFSFNVEFFKDRCGQQYNVLPVYKQIVSRPDHIKGIQHKTKLVSEGSCHRVGIKEEGLQAAAMMTDKGSGMGPLLKRCYCTLASQHKPGPSISKKKIRYSPQLVKEQEKPQAIQKQKPLVKESSVLKQEKNTVSKVKQSHMIDPYECEPAACIPGQCDPRECEQKIKRRGIRRKSRTAGTRVRKTSVASVASHLKPLARTRRMQCDEKSRKSMIVEQPRFPISNLNPQGIKFGSNITLNIEFYMETVTKDLPTNKRDCEVKAIKEKGNVVDKNNVKHSEAGKSIKVQNIEVQAANVKTENKSSGIDKAFKRCFCTKKLHKSAVPKPNRVVMVNRAEVIPYFQVFQTFPCSKDIKILENNNLKQTANNDEMKTLLPYKPDRFKQNDSISKLSHNNFNKNPKRLTAKLTPTSIHVSSSKENKPMWNSLKDAVRCCKYFFSKEGTKKSLSENKCPTNVKELCERKSKKLSKWQEKTKSELYNDRSQPKKSKSLKIGTATIDHKCKLGCLHAHPKYSRFQAGDNIPVQQTSLPNEENNPDLASTKKAKYPGNVKFNVYTAHVAKDMKQSQNKDSKCKSNCMVSNKIEKDRDKLVSNLPACPKCASNRDKQDKKGICAKDKTYNKKNKNEANMEETKAEFISPYISEVVYKMQDDSDDKPVKRKSDPKPKDITQSYKPLVTKGKCRCCICKKPLSPKKAKTMCVCGSPICAEERKKIADRLKAEAEKKAAELKKKIKPCTCGMGPCAKVLKKKDKKSEQAEHAKKAKKHASASAKANAEYEAKLTKQAKNKEKVEKMKQAYKVKMNKIKAKKRKMEKKKQYAAYLARQKQYRIEDNIRKKKRNKEDRYNDKQVEKYKGTPDCLLLAESLVDILKLIFIIFNDILRCMCRAVIDPKRVIDAVKTIIRDPKRIFVMIKGAVLDSGGASTIRRIKRRICAMRIVRGTKATLEKYAVTNYLLHIGSSDPKKRMRRRRPGEGKKGKEPIDFECSPYMGQLRKRPYLIVYYSCPWFYPHCLSLANALKQFLDILLFLSAIFVWCPCILCMEFVRTVTCWLFCTGG